MINVLLKHVIYQKAIDVIFSQLKQNFYPKQRSLKVGDRLKWIEVRFKRFETANAIAVLYSNGTRPATYKITDVQVFGVDNNWIRFRKAHTVPTQMTFASIHEVHPEDIVDYEIA